MANNAPLTFRKSGDPLSIPAGDYNAFIDAANYVKAQTAPGALTGPGVDREIWLRNDTGAAVDRFAILYPTGPVLPPTADNRAEFDSRIILKGIKPFLPTSYGLFAVAQTPADKDKLVRCKTYGLTPVKLDLTDGHWGRADCVDGESAYLVSHPAGSAQIVWSAPEADDETGLFDALVSLNFGGWWPRPLRGTTDASDANKVYLTGGFAIESVYSAWTGDAPGTSTAVLVDWLDGAPRYVIWQCPAEA